MQIEFRRQRISIQKGSYSETVDQSRKRQEDRTPDGTYERKTKNPLARLSLTIRTGDQSPITNHIPYPTSYFAIAFQETRRKILRAHLDPFVNHR